MDTAEAVFSGVASQAETIANDAEQVFEIMDVGDEVRQGDIYLTKIECVPTGAAKAAMVSQLAPGTTQGSRHCLRSLDGITLYQVSGGPLDGPIIDAPKGCAIDHPEHGNLVFPPGVYAVTFQRAFGEELRRVAD